jgi:hypothetical protein
VCCVLVFIQWTIQWLTFNRGARLITDKAASDLNFDNAVGTAAAGHADERPGSIAALPAAIMGERH